MSADITGRVILNRYRVDRFIEAGGMGAVYRIWDLARSVPLAMKVLHEDLRDDPSIWKMFQREADALKKLAHPHIVPFYGLFETPDFAFFLEHYVDGFSLKHVLRERRGTPLSLNEALIVFKALSAALGYAHVNGIVHCDIKPGNVLLDKSGSIFLTDFGIARHALSTTTTMASAGTPAYMAPEQIGGEAVTPATDVYALGILLFEMLTGRRPFLGSEPESEDYGPSTDQRIYYAQLSLTPTNPATLNPQVPAALGQVVLKAMEKEPPLRYASTTEMLQAACQAVGINPQALPGHIGTSVPTAYPAQTTRPTSSAEAPLSIAPQYPATRPVETTGTVVDPAAPQPLPARPRRNLAMILAAGGVIACLGLVALALFSAAVWRGITTVSRNEQTRPVTTPSVQANLLSSPTPAQGNPPLSGSTAVLPAATAYTSPTDTPAPAVAVLPSETLTAELVALAAPI